MGRMQSIWQKYIHQKLCWCMYYKFRVIHPLHRFYVYGGLQIFNGILADFYKLNIRSQEKALQWEKVPVSEDNNSPGPRAKHSLIAY